MVRVSPTPNERERIRRAQRRLVRAGKPVTVESVSLEAALPIHKVAFVLAQRVTP